MNATFYTFSKKENSTKRPASGSGTQYSIRLKDATGILSPQIEIHYSGAGDPSAFNYAYIGDFERYYFVREWTYDKGIWTAQLEVDALATWKDYIGAASLYVFRSSYSYNGTIVDNLYPTRTYITYHKRNITPVFNTNPDQLAGTFILGMIVRNDVKYIGCTAVQLANLIRFLFDDSYFQSVSNMATITPEIKVQINPMQYITKIHYIPARFSQGTSSWGTFGYALTESVNSLKVGQGTVTFADMNFSFYDFGGAYVKDMYLPINVSDIKHPQEDDRGRFLRAAPYTKWSLYLPPFGLMDLPSDDMADSSQITLHITADVRTGDARLNVESTNIYSVNEHVISSTVGNIAIDHPITGVFTPGSNFLNMAGTMLGAAAGAYNGNYLGLFSGAINAINSYAAGTVPHTSRIGSQGSGSQLSGNPELVAQYVSLVDDDNAGRGRPLCAKRTVSAVPGYLTVDPDELELPCYQPEFETVRSYLSNGFFYE